MISKFPQKSMKVEKKVAIKSWQRQNFFESRKRPVYEGKTFLTKFPQKLQNLKLKVVLKR